MRILWVKAGGVVPPDIGGRIRSYQILRQLARTHSVTLFSFHAADLDAEHQKLRGVFEDVICHPLPVATSRGSAEVLNFLRHFWSPLPYAVSKYCRPRVAQDLRALLRRERFDVIVCDFAITGGVIPWETETPVVLFTHNVEAQVWERQWRIHRNPIWKAVSWREYHRMKRFERNCLQHSEHVLAVSASDLDSFEFSIPRSKMTLLSTGVDTEYFRPSGRPEDPNALVFTGALDYLPNEDGLLWFAREVLPNIQRAIGSVTFTIVGRKPSERIQALSANPAIKVTGRVEDVRPYVEAAAVYVVPLRMGGGTRLKIFEAMAMGKAIVSTPLGAEGLPVTDRADIVLAETADAFADRVVALLGSVTHRASLGEAGRRLVESKYDWGSVASEFVLALEKSRRKEIPVS